MDSSIFAFIAAIIAIVGMMSITIWGVYKASKA